MPGLALEPQLHRTDPAMREHRFAVGRFGDDHARKTVLTLEEGFDAARIVGLLVAAEQERGVPARGLRGSHQAGRRTLDVAGAQSDRAVAGARSEEHTSELQSLMRISYAVSFLKKKNNQQSA